MKNFLKRSLFVIIFAVFFVLVVNEAFAFWLWSPKTKKLVNPQYAVKDTPEEQYNWAMRFFKENDFKRSSEEFVRLVEYYPDSDLSPEAQYYAGRSYEELGKYLFAFQAYQKTIDNYPYTKRIDELIEREYNIANIFQSKEAPKLMDLELSVSLDRAITVYKKIVDNAPYGKYADKSLYKMAECYRRSGKYKEAVESYENIINNYPESDLVEESKYQMAYTKYEASLNPEYDQVSTEEALKEFKDISKTTPVTGIADEADKVFSELINKKAESEIKIAEYYEKRKKYASALIYYKGVIKNFPDANCIESVKNKINELELKIKK